MEALEDGGLGPLLLYCRRLVELFVNLECIYDPSRRGAGVRAVFA